MTISAPVFSQLALTTLLGFLNFRICALCRAMSFRSGHRSASRDRKPTAPFILSKRRHRGLACQLPGGAPCLLCQAAYDDFLRPLADLGPTEIIYLLIQSPDFPA